MKRFICLLIVLIIIYINLTVYAAILIETENDSGDVTVSGTSEYLNMPVTIKVYDNLRNYYINQGKTNNDGSFEFSFKLPVDEIYSGKVKINTETESFRISTVEENTIEIPQVETVTISIRGYNNSNILSSTDIEIEEGHTVLDVLREVCTQNSIQISIRNDYVKSIDNLAEFDHGVKSGWMFKINNEFPDLSAKDIEVSNGDSIVWIYTTDLGSDVGNEYEETLEAFNTEEIDSVIENLGQMSQEDIDEAFNSFVSQNEDPEKLYNLAEKIVNRAGNYSIDRNNIDSNNGKLTAFVGLDSIKDVIEESKENADKMNNSFVENKIPRNKIFESQISIEVEGSNEKEVETLIERYAVNKMVDEGINKLEIKTHIANISINPVECNGDMSFNAKKLKKDDLNDLLRKKIPDDSIIIDLDLKIDGNKKSNFKESVEASIPYEGDTTNEEYVTVFFINDKGEFEIIGGKYDPKTKTVTFKTNHFSKFFAKNHTNKFHDIENISWAKNEIKVMASKGIINGKTQNTFCPDDSLTRAEFTALICRLLKLPKSNIDLQFKDVSKKSWYYDYVCSAYHNGLINGKSSDMFDPEGYITRQEISKIIGIVLKNNGFIETNENQINKFKDKNEIADWSRKSVCLAVKNGIITGMENEFFKPNENATRAQTAVMLYRLFNLIN